MIREDMFSISRPRVEFDQDFQLTKGRLISLDQ